MARKKSTNRATVSTNLGRVVMEILERNKWTQVEAGAQCDVAGSTIYRIIGGMRTAEDTLRGVCKGLAKDEEESRRLLTAHLLDEVARARLERYTPPGLELPKH